MKISRLARILLLLFLGAFLFVKSFHNLTIDLGFVSVIRMDPSNPNHTIDEYTTVTALILEVSLLIYCVVLFAKNVTRR